VGGLFAGADDGELQQAHGGDGWSGSDAAPCVTFTSEVFIYTILMQVFIYTMLTKCKSGYLKNARIICTLFFQVLFLLNLLAKYVFSMAFLIVIL
jgi:hypothetical protein